MKVNFNPVKENPFYGMKGTLNLFSLGSKQAITESMLTTAHKEIYESNGQVNQQKKELFYSLLFSIGDITARQHNIFKGNKVDSGGNSMRENFRTIMLWIKKNDRLQYLKFLKTNLFAEFTTFDNLLAARIKTKKKTNKVEGIIDMLGNEDDMVAIAEVISSVIKGNNTFNKYLVAKYLTRPKTSKRAGHKKMLPETKKIMMKKVQLLRAVSNMCDFPVDISKPFPVFTGYLEWRKPFIKDMESVLFSSHEIAKYDKEEFIKWIGTMPSDARNRVRKRILIVEKDKAVVINPKWGELGNWYLEWENYKKGKQEEQRKLEEEIRQGDVTEEKVAKLQQIKKEAKVNVGANNFAEMFGQIVKGTVDEVKLQPFLDRVNLPFNNLVFVDDSSSMRSTYGNSERIFTAFDFATFIATISLLKNPSDIGRSTLGLFSSDCRILRHASVKAVQANRLMIPDMKYQTVPLIQPELSFLDNLTNLRAIVLAQATYNSTYIDAIPEKLNQWVVGDSAKIEMLMEFPIWTIITDGNFNSLSSPEATMNNFMNRCQTYFGFKPFVIGIDVSMNSVNIERFSGIENFMFLPPNPAQVEQMLTNFEDIEIMDVYTPLNSLYKSNRYAIVRENVL